MRNGWKKYNIKNSFEEQIKHVLNLKCVYSMREKQIYVFGQLKGNRGMYVGTLANEKNKYCVSAYKTFK